MIFFYTLWSKLLDVGSFVGFSVQGVIMYTIPGLLTQRRCFLHYSKDNLLPKPCQLYNIHLSQDT